MVAPLATAVREVFRRKLIPARMRWWFVAEAMHEWYALLVEELGPELGGRDEARAVLARLSAPMLRRRYDILRGAHPELPDRAAVPRAVGRTLGALYRVESSPGGRWILNEVGGAPRGFAGHLEAERWVRRISMQERWEEVTCHLGELLVALTDGLPAHHPRARGALGNLCFAAGVRFGKKMKKAFALAGTPAEALEVLRMSEYVFRVNPEHWGKDDEAARTGWLEGTACPWYTAPGWNGAHCGIFGQFQSGISSAYGLRYHLTTTIPKHGGHTCRIDVKPIPLGRRPSPTSPSPTVPR